jgi:phospholipase/carboxylesterase
MAVSPDKFVHQYLPAPRGGDAFTFLMLHGTGGDERDLLHLGPALDEGAGMLAPRGEDLAGTGPSFLRSFGAGAFDSDELHVRAYELADWVRTSAVAHRFELKRVVAVGHGSGADMAASLLLLEPGLLAGAVLFRPGLPLEPERRPHLRGVAVFVAAGRADESVAPERLEGLTYQLRRAGADVTLHWDNAGREIDSREIAAAREWLRRRHLARGLKVHDPPL